MGGNTPRRKVAKSVTIVASPLSTPATGSSRSTRSSPGVDFAASTYGKRVFPQKPTKALPAVEESEHESEHESDADTTAQEGETNAGLQKLKLHLAQAKVMLSDLEKVAHQKKVSAQAKKLVVLLADTVQVLEESVTDPTGISTSDVSVSTATALSTTSALVAVPPGWSMYDFLKAEGKKEVLELNRATFATNDDRSRTLQFNGTSEDLEDSRYVCIGCFQGGYLPQFCVMKNLRGFNLHRKRGTGKKEVLNPCFTPAKVVSYKTTKMSNGGTTCQPVIEPTSEPSTCLRLIVPVNHALSEYCNIFFEASVIHSAAVKEKYDNDLRKHHEDTRGMTTSEKRAALKKVPKPACSKWRMLELDPTIQNMVDFNIYQFIREKIAQKRAYELATKNAGKNAAQVQIDDDEDGGDEGDGEEEEEDM